MGLMRYDSRVDECCCFGFWASRNALKAASVLAEGEKRRVSARRVPPQCHSLQDTGEGGLGEGGTGLRETTGRARRLFIWGDDRVQDQG